MELMNKSIKENRLVFNLTWLTSRPLLRGHLAAIWIGMVPVIVAIITLVFTAGLEKNAQGPGLCSGALFLSLGAILIQSPAFIGRVKLEEDNLVVLDRVLGKRSFLSIPRQSIRRVYSAPLSHPAGWLPLLWAVLEFIFAGRAVVTSSNGPIEYWYWLTAFVSGLSFWPFMAARWKATTQVIMVYDRQNDQEGFIHAWTTPHQANSLVNTLRGLIDWELPPAADQV